MGALSSIFATEEENADDAQSQTSVVATEFKLIDRPGEQLNILLSKISQCGQFALDCESIRLGRDEPLSLLNIALGDGDIYLIDIQTLGTVPQKLKEFLEDQHIRKLMYDCRSDADCLYHQYGISLKGILDMQLCAYAIEHRDLEPAQPLPSFLVAVEKYISCEKQTQLKQMKPRRRAGEVRLENWDQRPLKQTLLEYASMEISLYFQVWAEISKHNPLSIASIERASMRYATNRIKTATFNKDNPYQSNRFMPLDVLTDASKGPVPCAKCGIKLCVNSFSKFQLKQNVQKCVVCKAVKEEINLKRKNKQQQIQNNANNADQ